MEYVRAESICYFGSFGSFKSLKSIRREKQSARLLYRQIASIALPEDVQMSTILTYCVILWAATRQNLSVLVVSNFLL